jgi:oligopeptide/dipeptide ABC transporter ATP-binding protein
VGKEILRTRNLRKYFPIKQPLFKRESKWIKAVDGVDLDIEGGEILGIVGESGSGKTTLAKLIQGTYRPTEGTVYFRDLNIHTLPHQKMRHIWREIQYVYQNPGASFDPWWRVGRSLEEPLKIHEGLSKHEIKKRVKGILEAVGLREDHQFRYPHEFSGGQQRRLALARILVLRPSLIILDEPTSGLDVSIQATILKLLKKLRGDFGLTYIFISHDLNVVRMISDKMAVMYLGAIMEYGHTESVFSHPQHYYTQLLLAAVPKIEDHQRGSEVLLLGEVPNPADIPAGCRFWPRCPAASEICTTEPPVLKRIDRGQTVACHKL